LFEWVTGRASGL